MNRLTILLVVLALVGFSLNQDLLASNGDKIFDSFEGGRHPNMFSTVIWIDYDPDDSDGADTA